MSVPELIDVGIEDMKTASGETVLRTTLGSCIAICLYDPEEKSGGMAHVMLPSFEGAKNTKGSPLRYADSAIPLLLYDILSKGCKKERVYAKIAGGARMFQLPDDSVTSAIGRNNLAKVKDVLQDMEIDIKGESTGGNFSRTILFYLETGAITVKATGTPDVII
ncbi:MAG: chemotaxis protein CheD [Leptospirales bacterium]|nr:chemotaxis protein CheD [Leptospirales bacterium]